MTWKRWLLGLLGAIINSAATGGITILTGLASDPVTHSVQWGELGLTCLVMGLLGALLYLKEHREVWTAEERAVHLAGGVR